MKNKDKYDLSELDFTILFINNTSIAGFKVKDDYGTVLYMKDYLSKNSLPKIIETSDILRDYTEWLNSETEILDKEEKEYLKAVLKPFKNKIHSIFKLKYDKDYECIGFCLLPDKNDEDATLFPAFKKGKMYQGMKLNKCYTIEELNLYD